MYEIFQNSRNYMQFLNTMIWEKKERKLQCLLKSKYWIKMNFYFDEREREVPSYIDNNFFN